MISQKFDFIKKERFIECFYCHVWLIIFCLCCAHGLVLSYADFKNVNRLRWSHLVFVF